MTRQCCVCKRVEFGGQWLQPLLQIRDLIMIQNLQDHGRILTMSRKITHGYCPPCYEKVMETV